MGDETAEVSEAAQKTIANLRSALTQYDIPHLSHLTLPQIDSLVEQIAQVIPAGNLPGLILNGLVRMEGRQVPRVEQQRHLDMLFRSVRYMVDKAVFGAIFAGPAAVIIGYQKLLKLAGKDVDSAFPEGTWQFYLEYALREDTARHANETTGFHNALTRHSIQIRAEDALTAWIMAALIALSSYDRLLENEWRERVYLSVVAQMSSTSLDALRADWERQRPYQRDADAGNDDYPAYRRRRFDAFFESRLAAQESPKQAEIRNTLMRVTTEALPAYIRQMSILARLEPAQHQEVRISFPLSSAKLAVVYRDRYYLIPILDGAGIVTSVHTVRRLVAAIFTDPNAGPPGDLDLLLARSERASQIALREKTIGEGKHAIQALGNVPIVLNWDHRDANMPLSTIRQGRRGIGDHALTIFFTHESVVFDQSHIFFDGAWGAALAEIMTGEAVSWAAYLAQLPPAAAAHTSPDRLELIAMPEVRVAAEHARLQPEASAESTNIRLAPALALRRLFKRRNDLINVTVNDLLILYRVLHGQRYQPSAALQAHLQKLQVSSNPDHRKLHKAIEAAIQKTQSTNPAILIPMDASQISPRDRLYPTTFRNPMQDLFARHEAVLGALHAYQQAVGDRSKHYTQFDEEQRRYLQMIASFGVLMRRYKDVALSGQSMSTAAIKLLAHVPDAVQRLLDEIPGRFNLLNEIIKGEEVFSNIGRVAKGSTLRRFITAKDDNKQKSLAWGVITDDRDVVHISLRDFRPHVSLLHDSGMVELANMIAQDLLDSFAEGFNRFIHELREITLASRETRPNAHELK